MRNRANHERRGAAAVEFAVMLPFLVFLVVIAVDFGRVFYFSQIIENSARNGAIYASDPKGPAYSLYSNVQEAALADAADLTPQPTVTSTTGTDGSGDAYVAVTVTWQFNMIMRCPGVPNQLNLSRTVQMRVAPQ